MFAAIRALTHTSGMDLALWRQLRELSEACAAVAPEARDAWLQANVADPALRKRVRSMATGGHEEQATGPGSWEDALEALTAQQPRDTRQLGPWRLIQPIGDGGMGTVYLAERVEGGFTQRAAIKCLHQRWLTEEFIGRFEAERQILARLEHPAIARLLDGGRDAAGEPWLAMEYVEGCDLIAFCDQRRLGLAERLRLFRQVCAAVSHAHGRLIVHRDIKPSNVLVSSDGQVKLLDFGVAKLLDDGADAFRTGTVLPPMTPAYAAPEQLRGETPSTAMDIYALGVVLFELMSGVLPYRITGGSGAEAAAAILNSRPVAASNAYQRHSTDPTDRLRIAEARKQSPRTLRRALSGDLDAVLMKALRADPSKRYQTVLALSNDIARYLQHRPVMARRGNWRYRAGLFLRRHALASGLALTLFAALLGGLLYAQHQARLVAEQRDIAVNEAQRANEALAFLRSTFSLAHPSRNQGRQISVRELLLKGQQRLLNRANDDGNKALRAWLMEELAGTEQALGLVSEPGELLAAAHDLYLETGNLREAGRVGVQRGWLMTRTSSDEDAEAMVRDSLRLLREADSGQPPDREDLPALARAYHVLGLALGNRGNHEEGVRILKEAQELWTESGTPLYEGPSSTRMVLAYFLGTMDRGDEAETLLRKTVRELEDFGDDAASERAEILMTLGIRLRRDGRFESARELEETAVAILKRLYGEEHPSYWTGLGNLGSVYTNLGEHERAVELQADRLAFRRRMLGERVARTGATWRHYAASLQEAGRLREAREALITSQSILKEADPEQAERNIGYHLQLGRLLIAERDFAEAEAEIARTRERIERLGIDKASVKVGVYHQLGQIALESGREREGCQHIAHAANIGADIGSSLTIEPRKRLALVRAVCGLLFPDVENPVPTDIMTSLSTTITRSRDPSTVRMLDRLRLLIDQRENRR
ncbi:MAG: serine/threonine protein kinase [Xanthomonadales bacterium]|nr:serine/threonine protein kinase [Xanthomonadales bacterium]